MARLEEYPKWFEDACQELDEELIDGRISQIQYDRELRSLNQELNDFLSDCEYEERESRRAL
jgi:hypothetical protein